MISARTLVCTECALKGQMTACYAAMSTLTNTTLSIIDAYRELNAKIQNKNS
jgi:hypothetical protein